MATSTEPRTFRQRIIDLPVGRKLFNGFAALTCVLVLVIGCLFLTVARLGAANDQIVRVAADDRDSIELVSEGVAIPFSRGAIWSLTTWRM